MKIACTEGLLQRNKTSEKKLHTSTNLMEHIHTTIEECELEHNFDDITVNYSSTNPTDIHANQEIPYQ